MSQILASLVSSLKTTVTNISKLAVYVTNNTKLQLSSLGYSTKSKLNLIVDTTKLTVTSSKTLLGDIVQVGKLKVTYSLGIFYTVTNKIKVSASNLTSIASIVDYATRTKLDSILQDSKSKLQLSYEKTALAVSQTEKTVVDFVYLSKLKIVYAAGIFLVDWVRFYTDVVDAIENIILSFAKKLGDTTTVSDIAAAMLEYNRESPETTTILEKIDTRSDYFRVFNDNLKIIDVAGRLFPEFDTELLGTTDIVSIYSGYVKKPVEITNVTDSLTTLNKFYKNYNDNTYVTDTLSFNKTFFRNFSDTLTITDKVGQGFPGKEVEDVSTTDVIYTSLGIVKRPIELASISDSAIILNSFYKKYTENAYTTDLVVYTNIFNRVFNDIASTTDTVSFLRGLATTETLFSTDTISAVNKYYRSITEAATTLDIVTPSIGFIRVYLDTAHPVDSIITQQGFIRSFINETYVEVSTSIQPGINKSDTTSVNTTTTTLSDYFRSLNDNSYVADSYTLARGYGRKLDDTGNILDTRKLDIGKALTDSFSITEVFKTNKTYFRNIQEQASLVEHIVPTLTIYRDYSEISLIDGNKVSLNIGLVPSEILNLTDINYTLVNYERNINNIAEFVDNIDTLKTFNRVYIDTSLILETVKIVIGTEAAENAYISQFITLGIRPLIIEQYNFIDTVTVSLGFSREYVDLTTINDEYSYLTINKGINDILSTNTSTFLNIGSNSIDSIYFVDTISFTGNTFRDLTDISYINDSTSRYAQFFRGSEDYLYLSDTVRAIRGVYRNYTDSSITDDLVSTIITYSRSVTETANTLETITTLLQLNRYYQETANTTDTVIASRGIYKYYSDINYITDTDRYLGIGIGLLENTSTTDYVTTISSYLKDIYDVAVNIDTITTTIQSNRQYSEIANIVDTPVIRIGWGRVSNEVVSISELSSTISSYSRSVTETVNTLETISALLQINRYYQETANTTDTVIASRGLFKTAAEITYITDSSRYLGIGLGPLEITNTVDYVTTISSYLKSITDTIQASDSISEMQVGDSTIEISQFYRVYADIANLTEYVSLQKGIGRKYNETIDVTDYTSLFSNYIRNNTDVISALENVVLLNNFNKEYSNSTYISDAIVIQRGFYNTVDEIVYIGESTLIIDVASSIFEEVYLADTSTTITEYIRNIYENIGVIDLSTVLTQFERINADITYTTDTSYLDVVSNNTDTINIEDAPYLLSGYGRSEVEELTISEYITKLSIFSRNYIEYATIDDNYISVDVSTNITDINIVTDNISISTQYLKYFVDLTSISDMQTILVEYLKSINEYTTIVEYTDLVSEFYREYADTTISTDTPYLYIESNHIDITSVTDTATPLIGYLKDTEDQNTTNTLDSTITELGYVRQYVENSLINDNYVSIDVSTSIYDTSILNETVTIFNEFTRDSVESTSVYDIIFAELQRTREYTDSYAILDNTIFDIGLGLGTDDIIIPSDLYTSLDVGSYNSDNISSTDLVATISQYVSTSTDYIGITDTVIANRGFTREYEETIYSSDNYISVDIGVQNTDQTTIYDYINVYSEYSKDLLDNTNIFDDILISNGYFTEYPDSAYIEDSILLQKGFLQDIPNIATITDDAYLNQSVYRSFTDNISISENAILEIINSSIEFSTTSDEVSTISEYIPNPQDQALILENIFAGLNVKYLPVPLNISANMEDVPSLDISKVVLGERQDYAEDRFYFLEGYTVTGPGEWLYPEDLCIVGIQNNYLENISTVEDVFIFIGRNTILIEIATIEDSVITEFTVNTNFSDIIINSELIELNSTIYYTEAATLSDEAHTLINPVAVDNVNILEQIFAGLNVKNLSNIVDMSVLAEDTSSLDVNITVLGDRQDYAEDRFYFLESYTVTGAGEWIYLEDVSSIGIQNNYLETVNIIQEAVLLSLGYGREIPDTINTTESIRIVFQDYFLEDYVDIEYTGSTILS